MKRINWKYTLLIMANALIVVYLYFAMTEWNQGESGVPVCRDVKIELNNDDDNSFLSTEELRRQLEARKIYPLNMRISEINLRQIERALEHTPFVKKADCSLSKNGTISISVDQKMPLVRVKSSNGADYYIDNEGRVMKKTDYTSNLIIITGNVSQQYASRYLTILANLIMEDEFWSNQVEQINVLNDLCIELVPRVGEHVINIGRLPTHKDKERREELITKFVQRQFYRIETFYKYGLSQAGWNKYNYLSFKFSNQVICSRPTDTDSNI